MAEVYSDWAYVVNNHECTRIEWSRDHGLPGWFFFVTEGM
jgi:hypothetical protein